MAVRFQGIFKAKPKLCHIDHTIYSDENADFVPFTMKKFNTFRFRPYFCSTPNLFWQAGEFKTARIPKSGLKKGQMATMWTTTQLDVRVTPAYAITPLYCNRTGPMYTICFSRWLNWERAPHTHWPPDWGSATSRHTVKYSKWHGLDYSQ